MTTEKIKLSELVLDFSVYPRADVDSQHVSYLREAEDAGCQLPPVVIDRATKRVIDGFHRVKMWRSKYSDSDPSVEVIAKSYESEKDVLLDAIRYNANHGRTLTRYDRTHCILLGEKLHVPQDELASALSMTVERIGILKSERVGTLHVGKTNEAIALKRTIRHMSGQRLTKHQSEVNDRLGGMNQSFYANQLIMLIEADLLDVNDDSLLESLGKLHRLLGRMKNQFKARVAS